jgi:hypothetical protein
MTKISNMLASQEEHRRSQEEHRRTQNLGAEDVTKNQLYFFLLLYRLLTKRPPKGLGTATSKGDLLHYRLLTRVPQTATTTTTSFTGRLPCRSLPVIGRLPCLSSH